MLSRCLGLILLHLHKPGLAERGHLELKYLAYNGLGRWSRWNHGWPHVIFPEEIQNIGIGSQVKLRRTYAVR